MPKFWLFLVSLGGLMLSVLTGRWAITAALYLASGVLWFWHLRSFPPIDVPSAIQEPSSVVFYAVCWPWVAVLRTKERLEIRRGKDRFLAGGAGSEFFANFGNAVAHAKQEASDTGEAVWVSDLATFQPGKKLLGQVNYVVWEVQPDGTVRRIPRKEL